jgi:NADH-quinone oxidoreductase subunit J
VTLEQILFSFFAFGSILTAGFMITRRNPIISAIYLVANFFCLSGLYLTLHAQFIAVIQIFVYAGAIMVLFVFVIMLLNLGDERKLTDGFSWKKMIAGGLGMGVLMDLMYIFMTSSNPGTIDMTKATNVGTVAAVGQVLFTQFLFPFEITSLLLTAAIVGAIVLAKKKLD